MITFHEKLFVRIDCRNEYYSGNNIRTRMCCNKYFMHTWTIFLNPNIGKLLSFVTILPGIWVPGNSALGYPVSVSTSIST